jgi:hypothetical protein
MAWGRERHAGESIARRPQRGDWGLVRESAIGDTVGLGARNALNGESIAQRSRRPQRGDWGSVCESAIGDTVGLGARRRSMGKASHRGHRGVVCGRFSKNKEAMVRGWISKPQPRIEP